MKGWVRWVLAVLVVTLTVLAAAWLIYDHFYRIPSGPALPEQPPDKEFSKEVIRLNNRATVVQIDDPEAALSLYDQAVKTDPEYYIAYANKAQLLLQKKRYAEGARCLEKLTALRPRAAEYYLGHAFCLQRQGMADEAQERLLAALSAYNYRMEESPFDARLNRAVVLFLLGREYVARRELDILQAQSPDAGWQRIVSALRLEMDQAANQDPWSILGVE